MKVHGCLLLHLATSSTLTGSHGLAAAPLPVGVRRVPVQPALSLENPTKPSAAAVAALESRVATSSIVGATALVAGTTVGAGILALPAKTIAAGFGPASVALIGSWAYMAVSALLIAEVNVNTLCALDKSSVSMSSMASETVGDIGSVVASLAYAFIHYALLIAYMLEGGKLLTELAPALVGRVRQ